MNRTLRDSHQAVSELLPWYVNGTLGEEERARIDAHLAACATCRAALSFEQQVYASLHAPGGVEYMPAASLKKLQARLDGAPAVPPVSPPAPRVSRRMPWAGLMAACVAALAVAVSLLAAGRLTQRGPAELPGSYYTVTAATRRPPGEVIRAVFAPDLTVEQLQGVLDGARLRIVSGPSEAGVYSLASTTSQPVAASLTALRRSAAVRFAETTRVVTDSGTAP